MNNQVDNNLVQNDGEMENGKMMAERKEQEFTGRRGERVVVHSKLFVRRR